MKRFLTIFILVAMLASLFTLSAWADNSGNLTSLGFESVEEISYNNNNGAEGYYISIKTVDDRPLEFAYITLYSGGYRLFSVTPEGGSFESNNTVTPLGTSLELIAPLSGAVDGAWITEYHDVLPADDIEPTKIEICYYDEAGTLCGAEIQLHEIIYNQAPGPALTSPIAVRDADGNPVAFVNTLEEAVKAAPDGGKIEIRDKGTYTLPDTGSKSLNICAVGSADGHTTIKTAVRVSNNPKLLFGGVTIIEPPLASSVPATADNSNMPLWGGLFILFAAAALLTGKKRRS